MASVSRRVVVAMSGGVDSSVATSILKDTGCDVVGVGLQLVDPSDGGKGTKSCCGIGEMEDARRVAEKLGIPFYVLNFKEAFATKVIDYFVSSYVRGETPNPCIPCNERIKFHELLRVARGLGARFLATGHYARLRHDPANARFLLYKGSDESKDQSYFLYSLSQEQLSHAVFPIGDMTKSETRQMAECLGLKVHDKPESQDVCFIDEGGYGSYIEARAGNCMKPGPVKDESGAVIGCHRGLPHYTIGQRRGLGISLSEPMYVVDIDVASNSITVTGAGRLQRQERVLLENVNYISLVDPKEPIEVLARTRYRKPEVKATLVPVDGDRAFVEYQSPQEPTAPGQSVVLYDGDLIVGGGIVKRMD